MEWITLNYLEPDDFFVYLQGLSEDERAVELCQYSKRHAKYLLKKEMKKWNCFYKFMENYSYRDFKIIHNIPHVSQRVILEHVKYWNKVHPTNKINELRIFFM